MLAEYQSAMDRVTSMDGTSIAFDRRGNGPPVILVGGGLVSRAEGVGNNAPLAAELSQHFTVYNYDRRGRGDSGDTLPYSSQREIEDIEALITQAGGSAHLYGVSSGGALALEAAASGLAIGKLAVYDVPYCLPGDMVQHAREYVRRLGPALAHGDPGDGLALFMRLAGSSDQDIAEARNSPHWPGLLAIEHTLAYDAACMGDYQPPTGRLAAITRPTLVITGGVSPDAHEGSSGMPPDFFGQAADAIAASTPHAEREILAGQTHVPDPKRLVPVLERFFSA
jgi:pimeloyl-ACP methyl ester carboxylesterase